MIYQNMSIMPRPTLTLLLLPALLSAQTSFEAATIKPHDPKGTLGKGRILPGGRMEAGGMTLEDLLMFAYGVLPNMIVGLPKWARESQFDVVATAGHDTPNGTLRVMLQSLLAERFKLASHQENRVMPAFVIVVGKSGSKLDRASGGQQRCSWTNLPAGVSRRECQNMTMSELAKQLPGLGGIGVDLPVVDQTGLDGPWDFHLDVKLAPPNAAVTAEPEGPTIFNAFQQNGLELQRRKVPLPVLVIDHVEPLIEN
jgi:uncharacterized protein (TIGR03435 family)